MTKKYLTTEYILLLAFLFIGILYIGFTWNKVKKESSEEALKLARTTAAVISVNNISALHGNEEDLNQNSYLKLKETLKEIIKVNQEARFSYLLQIQDNMVIIIADSEPESSKDYSPPGQLYTEAPSFEPKLLAESKSFILGPYTDRWGTWISAFVPMKDLHTGETLAVFGIDYNAASWQKRQMLEVAKSTILMILSFFLLLLILRFIAKNKYLKKEIEHREEMETMLEESQQIAQMGSWEFDLRENKPFWSENCYTLYGLNGKKVKLSLELLKSIIYPEDHKILDLKYNEILATRKPTTFELRIIQPDGKIKWIQNNIVPVIQDEQLIKLKGINFDITERKKSEKALEEKGKQLNILIGNLPGMVYRCQMDANWTMNYISDPCYRITGYHPEELLNNNKVSFNDLILQDQDEVIRKKWQVALSNRTPFEHEYKIRDARGNIKWIWERGNCVLDEKGNCSHLEGYIEDITERKLSSEAVRSKDEQVRLLLDSTAEAIYGIDNNGICTFINQSAIRILGYNNETEVIGQNMHDLIHHSHANSSYHPQEECKVHKALQQFETAHVTDEVFWRANKTCFPVEYWSYPIIQENKTIGAVITFFDITDRVETEAALKQSEENFRNSLESSPLGIRIVTEKGESIYTNQAFLNLIGYDSLEEFKKIPKINYYSSESYNQHQLRKGLRKKGFTTEPEYEITIFRKDGEIRHLKVHRKEIQWDAKSQFQVIYQDITLEKESLLAKKKYELELLKAKEKAEESDRLKSAFLANMSHEIRTPMNGILGFAELLKDPKLNGEDQQEYIKVIEQSGHRMLEIINDIVDISKIESGQIELRPEETELNSLLHHLYTFFKPEADNKGLHLSLVTEPANKNLVLITDRVKLGQILSNLVKNAIKFTPSGYIEFGFRKKNEGIEFFVKDTGTGIKPDLHDKVFKRFVQGDNSISRNYEGAGLGLSIAKAYVELLGGKIKLESEVGKGSRFFFSLNPQPSLNKAITAINGISTYAPKLSSLNILVAEDDEFNLGYLQKVLQKENIMTHLAQNGAEAIDIIEKNPVIDMVLMDLKMPLINGFEATKAIKSMRPDLPVIIQSAFISPEDRQKAKEAGCDHYLIKPIKSADLINAINKCLKFTPAEPVQDGYAIEEEC